MHVSLLPFSAPGSHMPLVVLNEIFNGVLVLLSMRRVQGNLIMQSLPFCLSDFLRPSSPFSASYFLYSEIKRFIFESATK